jgi:hypothetical protein
MLLDERSRPDFRALSGRHASRAIRVDAAVRRIRLGGMDLGRDEIGGLERVRLVLGEMDALTLSSEADALASDPERRGRLRLLMELLDGGRLEIGIAPLAGWSPDFSVFVGKPGRPSTAMIGTHWFERPFPHPGPALGVVITGPSAARAAERFDEIWRRAHDLRAPIRRLLSEALVRSPVRAQVTAW